MNSLYEYLGWLFVVVLFLMLIPSILKFIFKKSEKARKYKFLRKVLKITTKLHKFIVLLIIILAPIHGYLALGSIKIHTGSLVYFSIILASIFGYRHYKLKNKNTIMPHKIFVIIAFCMLFIHILYPNLLWYMFT